MFRRVKTRFKKVKTMSRILWTIVHQLISCRPQFHKVIKFNRLYPIKRNKTKPQTSWWTICSEVMHWEVHLEEVVCLVDLIRSKTYLSNLLKSKTHKKTRWNQNLRYLLARINRLISQIEWWWSNQKEILSYQLRIKIWYRLLVTLISDTDKTT